MLTLASSRTNCRGIVAYRSSDHLAKALRGIASLEDRKNRSLSSACLRTAVTRPLRKEAEVSKEVGGGQLAKQMSSLMPPARVGARNRQRERRIVYFDALRLKIHDEGTVRNKAAYLALGIRADGRRADILNLLARECAGILGLPGASSCIRTKTPFEPDAYVSVDRSVWQESCQAVVALEGALLVQIGSLVGACG
jgi:hypothetical protein